MILDDGHHLASVFIISMDRSTDSGRTATEVEAPAVWLDLTWRDVMTGPQVRQIAALMLDAADEWDRVTRRAS